MKYKTIIYILALSIFGCSNQNDKSDAYGNFEAETVIVSAETTGKILQLNVEKGQKTEAGEVTALIDTTQAHLKLQQIDAQKEAVEAKRESILAQVAVLEEQKKNLQINQTNRSRIETIRGKLTNQKTQTKAEIKVTLAEVMVINLTIDIKIQILNLMEL